MKILFLLLIVLVASVTVRHQGRLSLIKEDYKKLLDDVRNIARKASFNHLEKIRTDLDYLHEGATLLRLDNNFT